MTKNNSHASQSARKINSVPRFDDYFNELSERLRDKYGLQHLIVTAKCPDFVDSPSPSIMFAFFEGSQNKQYYDCIREIEKSTDQALSATITGLGDQKFPIRISVRSRRKISSKDKSKIVSETNRALSEYLQYKILESRDYVVAMSLQTSDISSFFHKAITEGLRAFFGYEAASAFYYDYQSDSLVLGATTGISRLKVGGLRRADIKYHASSKSWVRRCFDSGKISLNGLREAKASSLIQMEKGSILQEIECSYRLMFEMV